MGTGIIIGGRRVEVPGVDASNYLDDTRLLLAPGDTRQRSLAEQSWVRAVIFHTTGGIPGGSDQRPQSVKPGLGRSTGGGRRIVASWTHDQDRPGGAHLVVDQDGRAYCCADLLSEAAYHAEWANGCTVGIEVVQGRAEPDLYQGQIEVAARLGLWVCRLMPTPIQWQIPHAYAGPLARFEDALRRHTIRPNTVRLFGHRDLTARRGSGDPGDAVMDALAAAGCERFDFSKEDLQSWKTRQVALGIHLPDGIPGPATSVALRRRGYEDGIWRLGTAISAG